MKRFTAQKVVEVEKKHEVAAEWSAVVLLSASGGVQIVPHLKVIEVSINLRYNVLYARKRGTYYGRKSKRNADFRQLITSIVEDTASLPVITEQAGNEDKKADWCKKGSGRVIRCL